METRPGNFLGLPERYSRYDRSRFVVLPIPYDSTASYLAGTREGPAAVLAASHHLEWFDEELERECYRGGVCTLEAVEPDVSGPEAMHEKLFRHARRVVRDGKFLIGLGGDHSISAALVRAAMTRHKRLSVLQIDAHADLRDTFQGSRYSHACVMRRIAELGARIVPVGIRAVDTDDHRFMKRQGIRPITARECLMEEDWVDRVLEGLTDPVYVTIDIDGFDPAYAPGTGTPEPGGLDWYQVTGLLRLVT
ncbi:MAG: agmatinase, partial [Planctomycetota bacterium]